jgi:hypothetical protein
MPHSDIGCLLYSWPCALQTWLGALPAGASTPAAVAPSTATPPSHTHVYTHEQPHHNTLTHRIHQQSSTKGHLPPCAEGLDMAYQLVPSSTHGPATCLVAMTARPFGCPPNQLCGMAYQLVPAPPPPPLLPPPKDAKVLAPPLPDSSSCCCRAGSMTATVLVSMSLSAARSSSHAYSMGL